jgi:ribosomal protein S8
MVSKRVTTRKRGYQAKKLSVSLPYTNSEGRNLVEKRTEEGYLLGWAKTPKGLKVYLRYTADGSPSRSKRERRSKPSRTWTAEATQRWGTKGERGRYLRQTTKGRRTSLEARKHHVGGVLYLWVR